MLKEINTLGIFFENCYKEISVREYARKIKISPPTASKILKNLAKQKLLIKKSERGFLFFRINQENKSMQNLSRIYWENKINPLINSLENSSPKAIVLFGSLSKLETTENSDIDIAIFGTSKEKLNLEKFEKEFKRKIQLFYYDSLEKVNKELKLNIINGYLLRGYLS